MKRTTLQDLREAADSAVHARQQEEALVSAKIYNVFEEILAHCLSKATEGEYKTTLLFSDYSYLLEEISVYQTIIAEKLRLQGLVVTHKLRHDEFSVSWEHDKGVGL